MKKTKTPVPETDFADAFFREVSEDVHNDNLKAFWKKYGVQIVALVVICLTVAVSFESIKHWRERRSQQWTNAFAYAQQLQNDSRFDEAVKVLNDIAENGSRIYVDEARLQIINVLSAQNKNDEALAKLEDFVKTARNDKLKNAALIKLATYRADTFSPEEMKSLLSPILTGKKNVWRQHAQELLALSFLRAENKPQALEIYEEILKNNEYSEPDDRLRVRAQNMVSVLTSDGENQ